MSSASSLVAPPVIADFSADGVGDVLVPCAGAHLGLRVSVGAGALLPKLLFCFLALAVGLVMLLPYGEALLG